MKKELYRQIGRRLRELRSQRGFTQKQVAKYLGINQKQLACYEKGTGIISIDILERLAGCMAVIIDTYWVMIKVQANRLQQALERTKYLMKT